VLIAFMLSILWAPPASAHLLTTGFGPFYDGLAHLFVTPEDLLPVVAIALLAGLRGPRYGRIVLFVLPAAWLGGSLAGRLLTPGAALPAATAVLTIALGALSAADAPLTFWPVAGLAAVLGLWNGGVNGIEWSKAHASALPSLGVACALFAVVALLAGNVVSVRAAWARIAVRVAGSWIAASGLFMLGWSLRAR